MATKKRASRGDGAAKPGSDQQAAGPKPRRGRPPAGQPKYRPEIVDQARKIAAQFGATDDDAAVFFGVSPRTIYRWKHDHPDFAAALQVGKDVADARVEQSLYRLANGYSQDAVKIFMPAGAVEPVYASYIEHHKPDVTAIIWWQKNRAPDRWRDRQDADGDDSGVLKVRIVNDPDGAE